MRLCQNPPAPESCITRAESALERSRALVPDKVEHRGQDAEECQDDEDYEPDHGSLRLDLGTLLNLIPFSLLRLIQLFLRSGCAQVLSSFMSGPAFSCSASIRRLSTRC